MNNQVLERIKKHSPGEKEFHQAVEEVYLNIGNVLEKHPEFVKLNIFERLSEPERTISFRVPWVDDQGNINVNRGYRVQMNSAIGPYKGGLRFHPSVNLSILKFLAFEQIFKNALTGLPMGGGKGGSDFDPKGKSDAEVMRFCQSFMQELARHIGHRTDVPAGDIGVGSREIGYLFGMYKKITNEFVGILTGKGQGWGGSLIRPEATGYGLIYFAMLMLEHKGNSIEGKKCLVSGSGNVAQFGIQKILQNGGVPVTCSDSSGFIYDKDGIDEERLAFIKEIKNVNRGRIKEYTEKFSSAVYSDNDPAASYNALWAIPADCAFPCATQNEINAEDAANIVKNGIILVAEGANMPVTPDAIEIIQKNNILYAPGKASNAGGVATSGLEMVQNYNGIYWTSVEVDTKLKQIMKNIHTTCINAASAYGYDGNYMAGANIAGFLKVARAMTDSGVL